MNPDDLFDEDGYPTEAALKRLEDWPYSDVNGALDFAASLWHWTDFVRRELSDAEREVLHADADERFIRFATGGWSGNESVISALDGDSIPMEDKDRWVNAMVRRRCWCLSASGGLHIYQYDEPEAA